MTPWIRRYAADRVRLVRPEFAERRSAPTLDADSFSRLIQTPEIVPSYDALASASRTLEPFRARQYARTIDGFYKSLQKTLAKLPEEERSSVADASLSAMVQLVARIGSNERLMPAIATLVSLLEKRGQHANGDLAKNAAIASETLIAFASAQEGRAGGHTALHLYRNLIEVLERRTKTLTADERPELWRSVATFIDRSSPAGETTQTRAADLNARVLDALAKGADWRGALAQAEEQVLASHREAHAAAQAQVAALPDGPLVRALAQVIAQNPAGDTALYASVAQLGVGAQPQGPLAEDVARLVSALARSPAAARIFDHLAQVLPALMVGPADILAGARHQNAGRVALSLIEAAPDMQGDPQQAQAIVAALEALSPAVAARAALALLPYLGGLGGVALPLALALAERAPHAADQTELDRFAQKFVAAHPSLVPIAGEDAGPIAAELARSYGANLGLPELTKIGHLAMAVKAALPELSPAEMIGPDGAGRPGLADLRGELRHDPLELLTQLLAVVSGLDRDRGELARRAIHLTREAALIDRDIAAAFPRILADWTTGLNEPERLQFIGKPGRLVAVRAAKNREGIDFLRAHDALPPELAFTAGLHLPPATLGWLTSKIESFRSHGHVRILRDLTFAAIDANRIDLLDAFASEKLDQKTMMANAEFIAVEFRQGRLQELPIDELIPKLKNGEDVRRRGDVAALDGLDGVEATPEGQAELAKWKKQLDALIAATPVDGAVYSDKGKNWRDPLVEVMGAIASGRWPMSKAQNEVGRRQLRSLNEEQIRIWMEDGVTGTPDLTQGERPDVQRAFTLLKGLKEALELEIDLGVEWTQAALDQLRAEQSRLAGAVHAAERGSPEHRRLSAELGPINRRAAVLELRMALEQLAANPQDAVTSLLDAKATVAVAAPAIHRLGARGCSEAIEEIRQVTSTIITSPREGRRAVDENTLEGVFKAFAGGCLLVPGGSNQVSLIEHIASAMYKIARTVNGDQTEARGFARLHHFTFPGYTHRPGIQLDILRTASGGTGVGEESKQILHKHMLAKAEAMGLPYLTNDDAAVQLAEQKGLRVLKGQPITFHVDHGHTGLHHAQNIDFGTYWILWSHAHAYNGLPAEPDDKLEADRVWTKNVILPRGVVLEDQP